MKTLYGIRDRVANELTGSQMYILFAFRVDQQAIRYFADAILDKSSILNKHPQDYDLVKCGQLSETGHISALDAPELIVTGDAIIAAQAHDS